MKDAARSKKAFYNTFRSGLMDTHPKMFSIFLVLAFIFLTGAAAFLISDILSFKADASHKASLSGFHLQVSKEINNAIKSWEARGLKLVDQVKNIILNKNAQNKTPRQKISTGDNGRVLRAKNSPNKAKNALAKAELPSLPPIPANSTRSSRNKTSVLPSKSSVAVITNRTESGNGPDSFWDDEPLQSDDYYSDGGAAPLINSGEIGSQINQSTMQNQLIVHNKSIDNITENLPLLKIAVSNNYSSNYLPSAEITNVSFNNSSSVSIASDLQQIDMNSLNSSNVSDPITPGNGDLINLEAANLNLMGTGNTYISSNISSDISSDSSSLGLISRVNPKANFTDSSFMNISDNAAIDEKEPLSSEGLDLTANETSNSQLQIEENTSILSLLDQRENLTSSIVMINNNSSSPVTDNISATNSTSIIDDLSITDNVSITNNSFIINNTPITNSPSIEMSEILSNNTNNRGNLSIKSHEDLDSSNNVSESANSSAQINGLEQSQLNTQTKSSGGSLRKSAMPLQQKFNKNTKEVRPKDKDTSTSSEDESVQSQSDSNSRFKKLKIQTPYWMAKT
jgi:hypothetical protein